MKKYLMGGIAAIALCAAFTSCSKSNDIYEGPQPTVEKTQLEKYQDAFVKEFGQIAGDQNWGFTDQSVKSSTRGENVNRSEWGTGSGNGGHIAVPKNVTKDEQTKVLAEFSKLREGVVNTIQINWTDVMVSQVYKGEAQYYDKSQYNDDGTLKDGATKITGSDKMNHLQLRKGEGGIDSDGKLVGDWEHINDFNFGNQNSKWGTIDGHTFMENSGTLEFAYHNSNDSKYHNEYIIIPGADIDPSLAGYYYVGFDFYSTHPTGQEANKNMDVDRDWIFNDWIVRIAPGEFVGSQRIFVEDLITSDLSSIDPSDWDFNDAVFDVFIYYNPYWENGAHNYAVITLRAAGGTLPLTVAGKEVHELFGVSTDKMVNTGYATGVEVAPVQFRLTASQVTSGNAKDIPVIVTARDGKTYTLTAEQGQPTQKIAAPIADHVKWLKERTHIKNGYPTFMDWIDNTSLTWYKPANDGSLFQKWY